MNAGQAGTALGGRMQYEIPSLRSGQALRPCGAQGWQIGAV